MRMMGPSTMGGIIHGRDRTRIRGGRSRWQRGVRGFGYGFGLGLGHGLGDGDGYGYGYGYDYGHGHGYGCGLGKGVQQLRPSGPPAASQRHSISVVARWMIGGSATTLIGRRRPPSELKQLSPSRSPREPGSAIVRIAPRSWLVVPAQWRTRHARCGAISPDPDAATVSAWQLRALGTAKGGGHPIWPENAPGELANIVDGHVFEFGADGVEIEATTAVEHLGDIHGTPRHG